MRSCLEDATARPPPLNPTRPARGGRGGAGVGGHGLASCCSAPRAGAACCAHACRSPRPPQPAKRACSSPAPTTYLPRSWCPEPGWAQHCPRTTRRRCPHLDRYGRHVGSGQSGGCSVCVRRSSRALQVNLDQLPDARKGGSAVAAQAAVRKAGKLTFSCHAAQERGVLHCDTAAAHVHRAARPRSCAAASEGAAANGWCPGGAGDVEGAAARRAAAPRGCTVFKLDPCDDVRAEGAVVGG